MMKTVRSMDNTTLKYLKAVYSDKHQEATYPYPYGGYDELLEEMYYRAGQPDGSKRVLDLNLGVGNLASYFYVGGCESWGAVYGDDSEEQVRDRLPNLSVIRCVGAVACDVVHMSMEDIKPLLQHIGERAREGFDVVVLSYDLRGMRAEIFVALMEGIFEELARTRKSLVLVGCVSFKTEEDRRQYEGEEKGALVFEEVKGALIKKKLRVQYTQLFPCGGLYKIKKK